MEVHSHFGKSPGGAGGEGLITVVEGLSGSGWVLALAQPPAMTWDSKGRGRLGWPERPETEWLCRGPCLLDPDLLPCILSWGSGWVPGNKSGSTGGWGWSPRKGST